MARDIISKILNNDPAKRPTVDEILRHPWINNGASVPRLLPTSTLACPPSTTYVSQFVPILTDLSPPANSLPRQYATADGLFGASDKNGGISGSSKTAESGEVWVRKWVDYSTKYGLGYHLSNDATGVFFNDSTKIVLDSNNYHFDFVERRTADRQDFAYQYSLAEYPTEL